MWSDTTAAGQRGLFTGSAIPIRSNQYEQQTSVQAAPTLAVADEHTQDAQLGGGYIFKEGVAFGVPHQLGFGDDPFERQRKAINVQNEIDFYQHKLGTLQENRPNIVAEHGEAGFNRMLNELFDKLKDLQRQHNNFSQGGKGDAPPNDLDEMKQILQTYKDTLEHHEAELAWLQTQPPSQQRQQQINIVNARIKQTLNSVKRLEDLIMKGPSQKGRGDAPLSGEAPELGPRHDLRRRLQVLKNGLERLERDLAWWQTQNTNIMQQEGINIVNERIRNQVALIKRLEDRIVMGAGQSGRGADGDIDFDEIKWGSFTKEFARFKESHPASDISSLKKFAKYVIHHPEEFSEKTLKRALFYRNVIEKKKAELTQTGGYWTDPRDGHIYIDGTENQVLPLKHNIRHEMRELARAQKQLDDHESETRFFKNYMGLADDSPSQRARKQFEHNLRAYINIVQRKIDDYTRHLEQYRARRSPPH
jgi:hypothetical protein